MPKSEDAVILMQKNLDKIILEDLTYLVGGTEVFEELIQAPAKEPFEEEILEFLNEWSRVLMKNLQSNEYPEIATFAFWLRKSSMQKLKEQHNRTGEDLYLGRGIVFHIAPSNVPVNFAYSLVVGLLTGNKNIVRVPTKAFPQVNIIVESLNSILEHHRELKAYIVLVRYDRKKEINDVLSELADTRIVWGGDATIEELRKSPLRPRSTEITFADRYSLAVIHADTYLAEVNKVSVAKAFYNDTYFSDQNACTSPRIVIWTGQRKKEAKELFWTHLHEIVRSNYIFQDIQGVNKLTGSYLLAAKHQGVKIEPHSDNLIIRVRVPELSEDLIDLKGNSGYFFEYDCEDILDLKPLCEREQCQTIGLLGEKEELLPLLTSGIRGVDRVVAIGKTMDFGLIWDGYDLIAYLTRIIRL